jgi:hypothetical protein
MQVTGLQVGETLTLVLRRSEEVMSRSTPEGVKDKVLGLEWSSPERAAWSTDGEEWRQTEPGQRSKEMMVYRIKAPAERIVVAWGPTYTPTRSAEFVRRMAEQSPTAATAETLATSRGGLAVPMLHVMEGPLPKVKRQAVWFSARQHAWESGSSWVAQGLAEWLLGPGEHAKWLRQNTEIFLVPLMDVDHVAHGQGGKEALPQDHNRDWSDEPHWPEVRAAQILIARLVQEGRFRAFIDLHNPGPSDREVHFHTPPDEGTTELQRAAILRFDALVKERISAVMPVAAAVRKSGANYDPNWKRMSHTWVAAHSTGATLALCIETPWNLPQSNQAGYRRVGAAVGETVYAFLQQR